MLLMGKKINNFLMGLLLLPIFSSCEKIDRNAGYGNYAIGIEHNNSSDLELKLYLDENYHSNFISIAGRPSVYLNNCDDLRYPERLTNIFVVPNVPAGQHKIEIRDVNEVVLKSLTFEIHHKECVFQHVNATSY
jgi:hypothetical protein